MDKDKVFEAKIFAEMIHKDQKYGKDKPYIYHLDCVNHNAVDFISQNEKMLSSEEKVRLQVIAYLHDTLEDSNLKSSQIQTLFDGGIENDVLTLTHHPSQSYGEYIFNIRPYKLPLIIKLCDLKTNMDHSIHDLSDKTVSKKFKKYIKARLEKYEMAYVILKERLKRKRHWILNRGFKWFD